MLSAIEAGKDVMAVMPTGYGKSLCFQLPAVVDHATRETPSTTIVVSPLIALMRDQVAQLQRRGVPSVDIHSGHDTAARTAILDQIRARAMSLIYVSPEQLRTLDFTEAIAGGVTRVAVDEAHCVTTWGHDFRPAYQNIKQFADSHGNPQRLAFTATASKRLADQIAKELGMNDPYMYLGSLKRPNLAYSVRHCTTPKEKYDEILKLLTEERSKEQRDEAENMGCTIIYCSTQDDVEKLYGQLKGRYGTKATMYHGGQPAALRKSNEDDFRSGKSQIMIATNAFGMGIDRKDVRLVIHHNIPGSAEAYLQETGRAGRDGKPSRCVLLYREQDTQIHSYFSMLNNPAYSTIEAIYKILRDMKECSTKKTKDGYFVFNPYQLAKIVKSLVNNSYKKDPFFSHQSPLALLQELGALEVRGQMAKLNEIPAQETVDAITTGKKRVQAAKLDAMTRYANSETPNQDALIAEIQ